MDASEKDKLDQDKLMQQLKDALVAIRKLKADLKEARAGNKEPLAVIGMSMRFPGGVNSPESYWKLLTEGRDAITDVPADRWDAEALYDPELSEPGRTYVKQGGFIDDVDRFDGSFFDITPVEIESMDPQQRILLELTHEALEHAGLNVRELVGSNTGVYVGIGSDDYQTRHFHSGDYKLVNPYSYTGAAGCAMAGRISYMMGFEGPSMSIDTACSASIISAHTGASALRNRECDMAVIGGVNLMLSPEMTIVFSNLRALSPDARCKTFDNSANGYVRSEGAGILVLKRLSDAQKAGDRILAVIEGSASNQDGRSNGFTAPNVRAQSDLIRKALDSAGLKPSDIDYIEAHGTGTKIGDPIEVEGLAEVFRDAKTAEDPLRIGSVKSNIGHLESAAGMASMIKAVLCLQHGELPPSIHVDQPNELIDWDNIPVRVVREKEAFPKGNDKSRRIGVSGFGITGTNGHIIIGDVPEQASDETDAQRFRHPGRLLLPLSARSAGALRALAGRYADLLERETHDMHKICASAALRRAHFPVRKLFVAETGNDLVDQLRDLAASGMDIAPHFDAEEELETILVFSGQGAQWPGMGLALAAESDVFREALEECNAALKKYVDWDLFEELARPEDQSRLKEGDVMQPLLMAIGVALARWWMHAGVRPDCAVGHSMGEIAAAHIAGHITLDEAARIVTERSRLMEKQAGGAMLATDLTEEEAEESVKPYDGKLSVSVLNSPSTTVIGGSADEINDLFQKLEADGRWCRKVRMTVAAHTAQMDPVLEPLGESLQDLKPTDGPVRFYSSSQNRPAEGRELNADYWVKNVRNSVQFGAAIRKLAEADQAAFIEVGPHAVLTAAVEDNLRAAGRESHAAVVSSFYRNKEEVGDLYRNLGALYTHGVEIDWAAFYSLPAEFIDLPTYAWQKERYWFDEEPDFRSRTRPAAVRTAWYTFEAHDIDLPVPDKSSGPVSVIARGSGSEALAERLGAKLLDGNTDDLPTEGILVFPELRAGNPSEIDAEAACMEWRSVLLRYADAEHAPRIILLARHALSEGPAPVNPAGAMLWGMTRTVRNEYPLLDIRSVDVEAADTLTEDLLRSIAQSDDGLEFRVRNGKAAVAELTEHKPERKVSDVSDNACFIVTGGTSGLGLAFAEWLSRHGVKKLALTSRSGMKEETAPAVERMTQQGSTVEVLAADISTPQGVRGLIDTVEDRLGRVTGLVHAAGLVDDGTLATLEEAQFRTVAAPKVYGTWYLHEALKDRDLSHFIVFSSAAEILGTVGQANYNAANSYIDRLVFRRTADGLPATAVNWGNIGGTGMAAAQAERGDRFASMGFPPVEPNEFDDLFHTVFHTTDNQLIPMKIDWATWTSHYPALRSNPVFTRFAGQGESAEGPSAGPGSEWGPSPASAGNKLRRLIRSALEEVTRLPAARIREDETFKSMGLDSMQALQLRNRIQETTGLSLAVTSIWAHPTVQQYAAFLLAELDIDFDDTGAGPDTATTMNLPRLKKLVREAVSSVTKLPAAKLDEGDTFKSMGVDSMQALQIRNRIQSETGLSLPASSIWAHPTVEQYAVFLQQTAAGEPAEASSRAAAPEAIAGAEKEVEDLSLDDLMQQLDEKTRGN